MASVLEAVRGFFSLIRTGRYEALLAFLSDDVSVDDPIMGRFEGQESFSMFAWDERRWLSKYNAGIEPINSVYSPEGMVTEYNLTITVDGRRKDLPVAMAADLTEEYVTSIRIYFSVWPINGTHQLRSPTIPEVIPIELPEVVEKYMTAIRGTNVDSVLDLFEDDACVREPSGNRYKHSGKEELRDFYTRAISGGGIPLKHCKAISHFNTTAVEYFFSEWNGVSFPPQPGIVVYDIGRSGRLSAARIYDDAEPPFQ